MLSALLRLVAAAALAQQPATLDVQQLVDRANKALRGDSSHGLLTMTITTPDWRRELEVEGWNRGRTMAFIKILAPAKERGEVTLRRDNQMWVWMPNVERVIKIPPAMLHDSWQGSDFNYEDIIKADSVVKDYTHKLLGTEKRADHTTYKIEADPRPDAPVVWGKVLLWIGQYGDDVLPEKEEDYSERGELIRTITLSEVKLLGGRKLPSRLECVPAKKTGRKTVLVYHSLDFDIKLPDSFFSMGRLQRAGS